MPATIMTVDFSKAPEHRQHKSGVLREKLEDNRPRSGDGKLLTPKQIRARARRKMARSERMTDEEFGVLYKPVEEWDLQELARGRPRNSDGNFRGPHPKWVSREIHERSLDLFKQQIKADMNKSTPNAMRAIEAMLLNEEVDERGRPMVPYSTKLDAAKFLLEHTVGKPTVRIENDLSVKLQGILGVVMANPNEVLTPKAIGGEGYSVGHLPGVTMPMAEQDDVIDAEIMQDVDYG